MSKTEVTDLPDCVVCGTHLHRNWVWTDYHGEFECKECGMVYDMKGYRDVTETRCRLKAEEIPIIREYWEETKRRMPFGVYLKQTTIQGEQIQAFNAWIKEKHPELLEEQEDKKNA